MAVKVTDSTYQSFTESGIALIDFKAEWCSPCKALSPIVEELSNEYDNVRIGKVDVDENPETSKQLGIRSIPTILIYKDGQIVDKHVGGASKAQLKSLIDKHLN
jgi:thioredoxin 1